MVHTLRYKKVCDTSPESYCSLNGTTFNFDFQHKSSNNGLQYQTPMQDPFAAFGDSVLNSTRIDPIVTVKKVTFDQIVCLPPESMENSGITTSISPLNSIGARESNEDILLDNITEPENNTDVAVLPVDSDSANNKNSLSLFQQTLGSCIDHVVFERSFNKIGGVSLYAIKKALNEEFGYDTFHFRKSICAYVRECLANGTMDQFSGRGGNGSVRLAKKNHRTFIRNKNKTAKPGIVKAKYTPNITNQLVAKRFSRYQQKLRTGTKINQSNQENPTAH